MVGMVTHSTNEDSIEIERHETHFGSTNAAVESCSKIRESLLEECVKQDDRDGGIEEMKAESIVESSVGLCMEDDDDIVFEEENDRSSIHSLHEGVDLCFVHDYANDSTDNVKISDCNSSGRRKLFEVSHGADLVASEVSTRFKMDFEGSATFMQCTSLCFNRTRLRGSLIVFQKKGESPCWKLGIVSLFKYSQNGSCDDMVTLYEWIGEVSRNGSPKMFECVTWDELSVHLNIVTLRIDDVNGYFVNQVCLILL